MKSYKKEKTYKVRNTLFSFSTFFKSLGVFLLISGIHTALILGVNELNLNKVAQIVIIILYWVLLSVGITILTHYLMKKTYEEPMQEMAKATSKVANGDFSVYVPTIHTDDKLNYLDVMIMDFNRMVEELGSIETLKTEFFSNVSHEIKTPIAVIQNTAQLLSKQELPENQKQHVQTIIYTSKKLSKLITNILKLNKLEKQNIQPVMEEYDLCRQLCECALQFESLWEEKEIDFDVDIEGKIYICADESLLELVWTNLLSNALKFTDKGGKILLKQKSDKNSIVVSISDSGCGMKEETIKHIFEKFYQGDTSHSTSGNGLGLSLVLRIVQMMDGRIEVDSEYTKGSTFTVYLPKKVRE